MFEPKHLQLSDTLDLEVWFDHNQDFIYIKLRQFPTGEIRDGKKGVMFRTSIGALFDIADGQEYPLVCSFIRDKSEPENKQ